jgi:hypothetical protein
MQAGCGRCDPRFLFRPAALLGLDNPEPAGSETHQMSWNSSFDFVSIKDFIKDITEISRLSMRF